MHLSYMEFDKENSLAENLSVFGLYAKICGNTLSWVKVGPNAIIHVV